MLRKRAFAFRPQGGFATELQALAIFLLEMFPLTANESFDSQKVSKTVVSMLSNASDIFTEKNFKDPCFPLKFIKDVY